jgi:hypothetical protein
VFQGRRYEHTNDKLGAVISCCELNLLLDLYCSDIIWWKISKTVRLAGEEGGGECIERKKILKHENTSISNFNAIRSDVFESFNVGKGKDGRRLNLKRKIMANGMDYTRLVPIILVNYC